MNKKLIYLFLFLFTTQIVKSQTQSDTSFLDPVTVTSSLIEKRISETGRNISIIKGEKFAQLPVHSVDELLRYIPGVEIQMRGAQGSQSDISIRGGTFQQALVILDGLRLNDPNTGHFSAYIPIAPAEIERIEVLKGASSAIYGSDAVGGVINIITKTFHAKQQQAKTFAAQASAGEYGLIHANIGGFFQTNKLSIGAGIVTNHAAGQEQRGVRGFFHNTSTSIGLNYQLNKNLHIAYRSAYDYRNFSAQNFYTSSALDTATEKITSFWHQVRIGFEKENSAVSLDAGYKKLKDHYVFFDGFAPNDNDTKLLQALLTYKQYINEKISIVSGFNFQNKKIESNDRGNHQLNTAAPFVSAVQKIGKNFSVMPSLRVEFIENLNAEWIPNVTLSYKIKKIQLRASGGKTIRDADFTERYNNFGKISVPAMNRVGNPFLVMEKSWGYETGFDYFFHGNFKLSTTFFQRFNSNLLDWVNTSYDEMPRKDNLISGATYLLAKNISALTTTGYETDLHFTSKFSGNQSLFLDGGILWQHSKSSDAQSSFYISSHARFMSNFSAQYSVKCFAVSVTGLYKNRQPQNVAAIHATVSKDYFVMNGKISYRFIKNKLGIFMQTDNIFDRKYSDVLGAQMPGRWLQGGVLIEH
jgi:iron complex outermembrane receptor protein